MNRIDEIADTVELQVWASGKPATSSALEEQLRTALSDDDQEEAEKVTQNVLDECQVRQQMLGDAYPFNTNGSKLRVCHQQPTSTTYLFCLALSVLPAVEIEQDQRVQFESVVVNAAASIFGGAGLRIGAPWKSARVPTYGALLDKVVELIPNLGVKIKTKAPAGGDAGWDVLVVKNFCDKKIPRFVALGNCATGRTDWMKKGMETQPTLFWSYFQATHSSVQITFFAVPFTMDEDSRLRKFSPTCLTLDRFRICEHAPGTALPAIADWVESERENALKVPLI